MTNYLIRRLLLVIPTLFFASLITFFTIRLIPGDVIDQMLKERESTNPGVDRAMIERSLGLDAPIHVQYGRWVSGILLRGDMGKSLWSDTPVTQDILSRLPVTFELGLIALIIGLSISPPVSPITVVTGGCTWPRHSRFDMITRLCLDMADGLFELDRV